MIMADTTHVQEYFKNCKEPKEFSGKYYYFNKQNKNHQIPETLQCIEEMNLLGALYIAVSKVRDTSIRERYIEQFIERNRELLIDNIQNNNDFHDKVYYMQVVYLCLMNISREECQQLCSDIFSGTAEEEMKAYATTKHYAYLFLEAVKRLKNDKIAWEKKYCLIVASIFRARNEEISFLYTIEFMLRHEKFGRYIDEESEKEYFDILCEHEAYKSAKFFLKNFDDNRLYLGMQPQDFVHMLYRLPSPELLAFGRKYMAKVCEKTGQKYTYNDWLADVEKYNHDAECIKWTKLTVYYFSLQELVDQNDINGFNELTKRVDEFEMFDVDQHGYFKQMLESFVSITDKLLLSDYKDLVGFLKAIENISVGAYSRAKYLFRWKDLLNSLLGERETGEAEKKKTEINHKLFENYSVEDAIYIYMNSHIKWIINLEDFVKDCAARRGEDIYDLFKDYALRGRISPGSKKSSVRDKLFLTPLEMATGVTFLGYLSVCREKDENGKEKGADSPEAKEYKARMFRSDEGWYSQNKEIAELMRVKDHCDFYLKTYKEKEGIFVSDISLCYENIRMEREEERNNIYSDIMDWLSEMQESEKYVEWDKNNYIYGVAHLEDKNERVDIALEILYTISALQNNVKKLQKFINAIIHYPLEEINEFRYIPNQKKLEFFIPKERYQKSRREIIDKAENILSNRKIPIELRKSIYLNTCIRKFYDLREACRYISKELYLATAEEPFVMALKFENHEQNIYNFSTKMNDNTFWSYQLFKYKGKGFDLTPNFIYLVSLKEYDFQERCFILDQIDLQKDQIAQWDQYLRRLRDIKKVPNLDDSVKLDEIQKDLETYHAKVTSDIRISQLAYELDLIFKRQDYNIESAIKTLALIEKINPFRDSDIKKFNFFVEQVDELYGANKWNPVNTYQKFLDKFRENGDAASRFCDLFFISYLKAFIPYEEFFEKIAGDESGKKAIINYCGYRKYI